MNLRAPLLILCSLLLAGCGESSAGGGDAATDAATDVVVGAYPLEYLATQIGGEHVQVRNVANAGVEPHDLELTPRDVAAIGEADLVVALQGFQPALDSAAEQTDVPRFEMGVPVDLKPVEGSDDGHGHGAGEDGAGEDGPPEYDPHFWLDPLRMAQAGDALADRLIALDPDNRRAYRANAVDLRARMEALHEEYVRGLANCRSKDLVTAHEAFNYLASRYGLRQRAIAGIDPEGEPSPAALAEVTRYVRENNVSTVYAEVLTDERIARTVTEETGAKLAALDTIEMPPNSPDVDYLTRMRGNLAVLREGQGCR